MNCRDFQEIIDSYLSDELLTETNHNVLRHMENCVDCRRVIEARRAVRDHLRSAVMNAPQYQIGKNFTHNLRTQLKYEAFNGRETKTNSWFGIGSWIAVAAGLVLVFTFGFILLNNQTNSPNVAESDYTSPRVQPDSIINVAFKDHQYCAISHDAAHPVRLVKTPARYEKIEQIAMPQLKTILADYEVKKSHTCEYSGTKFTHLIVKKDDHTVSLMLTSKDKATKLGEKISLYSSKKYELARFDIADTAVFVISGLDKKINSQVAEALFGPLQKHLTKDRTFQTALLTFY
jgi:hypothetical protein